MNEYKKVKLNSEQETSSNNKIFKWCITKSNEIVKTLGIGHRETIYHEAFCLELRNNGLSYESERVIPVIYKNQQIGHIRADIIIDKNFILEFKAINKTLGQSEVRQIKNYMNSTGIENGLLINFGKTSENIIDYLYVNNESKNHKL